MSLALTQTLGAGRSPEVLAFRDVQLGSSEFPSPKLNPEGSSHSKPGAP